MPWLHDSRRPCLTRRRTSRRALVGRRIEGLPRVPSEARVRILPLPRIGHAHADRSVRRVLVEIPAASPIRRDDLELGISGAELHAPDGSDAILLRAADWSMAHHYGVEPRPGSGSRLWRSISAVALPPGRWRSDLRGWTQDSDPAARRGEEEARARRAVSENLKARGRPSAASKESRCNASPLNQEKGARAEAFALGTRFAKERMWHVEDRLPRPRSRTTGYRRRAFSRARALEAV